MASVSTFYSYILTSTIQSQLYLQGTIQLELPTRYLSLRLLELQIAHMPV